MEGCKKAMYTQAGKKYSRFMEENEAASSAGKKAHGVIAPEYAAVPEPQIASKRAAKTAPYINPAPEKDLEPYIKGGHVVEAGSEVKDRLATMTKHTHAKEHAHGHYTPDIKIGHVTEAEPEEKVRLVTEPKPKPAPVKKSAPKYSAAAEIEIELSMPVLPDNEEIVEASPAYKEKGCNPYLMAMVKNQRWENLYDNETGFSKGTIFKDLDLPFKGEGACRHG